MRRRVTAVFLMLCLAFFSAEALVADVHDGDAGATRPQLVGQSSSGAPFAKTVVASRPGASPAVAQDPPNGETDELPSGAPAHAQHVCHCVHAHGLVDPAADAAVASEEFHLSAPTVRGLRTPASLGREPQLRPPIA